MADPLAGAVLAPIGNVGADPLAGAQLVPLDAPNLVQRGAAKVADFASKYAENPLTKMIPGASGALELAGMVASPLTQHTDPTGQGRPLPMGVAAAEDIAGGVAQGLGATAGEVLGPLGAMAGAGAGAAADDILNAKVNQQLYGWGYQPSIKGLAGTAALGAITEGLPRGIGAIQRRGIAKTVAERAGEAAGKAEEGLYSKELPEQKAKFEEKLSKIDAKTAAAEDAAKAKAQGEVAKSMVPKAAQMELENFVGRTPAEREAARNAPELFFARRRKQMADATVFSPMRKFGAELGEEYERVAPPEILAKPAGDISKITEDVHNEMNEMRDKGFGSVTPKVAKLMQTLQQTDGSDWAVVAVRDSAKTATQMLKNSPEQLEQQAAKYRAEAQSSHDTMVARLEREYRDLTDPNRPKMRDDIIEGAKRKLETARNAPVEIPGMKGRPLSNADLLGFQRLANSFIGSEDGPSSIAASVIRDSIDNHLQSSGINIPPDLKMRYAAYKNVFDPSFRRAVATATHPEEYAKDIFTEPQRFNSLMKRAEPGDKIALRKLFGDWAISIGPEGLSKQIADGKLSSSVPRALFGDTPYARLQPWIETDAKSMGWERLMAQAPPALRAQAEQQAKDAAQAELRDITSQRARALAGAGRDLARKLGPAGAGILATMKGMTPEAAAQYTLDTFKPILGDVPEPMPPTGSPQMRAYRESKAIQKGIDISAKRREAAIQRIIDVAQHGDVDTANLKRKARFYVPLMGFLGASGHISPYLAAAGTFSLLGQLLYGPRQAFLKVLADPEAAAAFYEGIKPSANALNATKPYARRMGEAAAHLTARSLTQQAASTLGLSAGVPPEDKGEGE